MENQPSLSAITEVEWVDTHSHLFLEEFDADREAAVQRAHTAGISRLYLPNIDAASLPRLMNMVHAYPGYAFPLLGLHPTSVTKDYSAELDALYLRLSEGNNPAKGTARQYVGIGEIGMDLYWDDTFREEQRSAFRTQIRWAKEFALPICIHCRKAFAEVFEIVASEADEHLRGGIFHCFEGSAEEAAQVLSLPGFYFGIGGVVTYKKSTLPRLLQEQIPLERIVLETDCPYLAPVPMRGKRNESSFLIHTAQKVAETYGQPLATVAHVTTENALRLFAAE